MKLIVGLGNPGLIYENTRHNLGFRSLKIIAKKYKARFKSEDSLKSRIAAVDFDGTRCLLALPSTFMNLSGEAVKLLMKHKRISPEDLLVVHDDIDLELGSMRFKKCGSSGGHKGISSIIGALATQDFNRLKLGIGRSSCKEGTKNYVLSGFSKKEVKVLDILLDRAADACEIWARLGIDKAMNEFNQVKPKLKER